MLLFCEYWLLHQAGCKGGEEIIQKQQGIQLMFISDGVNIRLSSAAGLKFYKPLEAQLREG